MGVFAVPEGLVCTGDHRFEVAQHCVDPLELRQILGFALAHDLHSVDAPGFGHGCKASQAVAEYNGAWDQAGLGPLRDCIGTCSRGIAPHRSSDADRVRRRA